MQKDKLPPVNRSPLSPNEKRKAKVVVPNKKSETKLNESPTKTPTTPLSKLSNKLNKTTEIFIQKAATPDIKTTQKSPHSGMITIFDDDSSEDSEEEKKVPGVFTPVSKKKFLQTTLKDNQNLKLLKQKAQAAAKIFSPQAVSNKIFSVNSPQ